MIFIIADILKAGLYFPAVIFLFINNLSAQSITAIDNSFNNNVKNEKNIFLSGNEINGKIIDSINILILDISGSSIFESDGKDTTFLEEIANAYRFKTRDWVVRSKLLFNAGDTLNSKLLEESERILRNSGYFKDAVIKIQKSNKSKKNVNVLVIVQEKWTLSFLLSYNADNKNGYIGLNDENFLGLGHKFNLKYTHDQRKAIGSGGEFNYIGKNIEGTFINAGIRLRADNRSSFQSINLSRPFITAFIPWSGELNFSWEKNIYEYIDKNENKLSFKFKENIQDIWIGKNFELPFLSDKINKTIRFFAGFRANYHGHPERPFTSLISYRIFENYSQYLFNIGILNRRFYKDKFIDKFGITEDIPIGEFISFTTGKENREYSRRIYFGIETIYSRKIENFGYASADLKLGGFRNNGNWEQNILNFNLIYHTNLFREDNWKYRFFLQNNILYGFNRFNGEQIYLDTKTGVRGLEKITLYGTKRITINLEGRLFSPFSPFGFSLGSVLFADFGIISNTNVSLSRSKLYQSYGIGIRTRNESIVNADFSISLAYIPINNRTTAGSFKILFSTNFNLGTRDFGFGAPAIFNFVNN